MGTAVRLDNETITVKLTGWDRVMNLRRYVRFERTRVRSVTVAGRRSLERHIDHRVLGYGTHDGSQRPNRRRVGTMLGRAVIGKQFWAVPAGRQDGRLLVIDLDDLEFSRVVLSVDDPPAMASTLATGLESA